METKRKSARVAVSLLALAGLLVFSLFAVGGSLEPSAPPGPTMKTLDEVEPRVPIHASDLPLTITEPNSYYLVEDVNFTDTANHAITIECNDVTIDLMGYSLKGPDSGTKCGVYMSGRSNVEIRNGTVRNFHTGIYEPNGLSQDHRVIDVRAVSNGQTGIYLYGKSNLVKDCTASENGTSAAGTVYGIRAGNGSTIIGNMVRNNGTSASDDVYGIYTFIGSTLTGNTVYDNGDLATGDLVYGIYTFSGNTLIGNTVYGNGGSAGGDVYGIHAYTSSTVTSNTSQNNGHTAGGDVYGIYAYSGSTVSGNSSRYNGHSASGSVRGISAGGGSSVTSNTAHENGTSAKGTYVYGIYASGGCTVTGNTARYNGTSATGNFVYGIYASSGCTVTGNTADNNGNLVSNGTVYGIYLSGNNFVDQNTAYGNGTGAGTAINMDTTRGDCTYGLNHAPIP